jgi:hypothetical protein
VAGARTAGKRCVAEHAAEIGQTLGGNARRLAVAHDKLCKPKAFAKKTRQHRGVVVSASL